MQAFCETYAALHLFYILIGTIVHADGHAISERQSHLEQQRIIPIFHKLAYFRHLLQTTMYLLKVLPLEE